MQGTRLPDAVLGESGPGWEAWENGGRTGHPECVAGAYMKVTLTGYAQPKTMWYIKDPNGKIGSLVSRSHTVVEHEDGTISVKPSILADDPRPASEQMGGQQPGAIAGRSGWHGYLEHGIWREC